MEIVEILHNVDALKESLKKEVDESFFKTLFGLFPNIKAIKIASPKSLQALKHIKIKPEVFHYCNKWICIHEEEFKVIDAPASINYSVDGKRLILDKIRFIKNMC